MCDDNVFDKNGYNTTFFPTLLQKIKSYLLKNRIYSCFVAKKGCSMLTGSTNGTQKTKLLEPVWSCYSWRAGGIPYGCHLKC